MDLENELRALEGELERQAQVIESLKFDVAAIDERDQLVALSPESSERMGALLERMSDVHVAKAKPVFAMHSISV